MTETKPPPKVPFFPNLQAPELFASAAGGFSNDGGTIKITFISKRMDLSKVDDAGRPASADVQVGTLVMPLYGAAGLASGLFDYLKNSGLLPDKPETAN